MSENVMLARLFRHTKIESASPPTVEERDSIIAAIDQAPYTVAESPVDFPPSLLVAKLNAYLEIILSGISASGGRCLRHIGCAVIAEWPYPQSEPARRILGDGLIHILERTRNLELTPSLRIRPIIGVAHGHVIHSTHYLSGNEVRLEMGPAVSRANQLCSMCTRHSAEILFYKGLPVSWPSALSVESLGPVVIAGIADSFELQTLKARP